MGDGSLRILGIDPGSTVTGYGVIDRRGGEIVHCAHGTIRPGAGPLHARLARLYESLVEIVEHHRPDVASVEQVFVAHSARSALVLGQARGALLAALGRQGVTLHEYTPAQIKQAVTSSGRAAKGQIQRMVRRSLALDREPAQDAADALAAALCHAHAGRLAGRSVRRRSRGTRARGPVVRVRRAP